MKTWIALGVFFVALCAACFFLNREHAALLLAQDGKRNAEARLAGQIVASQDTEKDLKAQVVEQSAASVALRQALENAVQAQPDARPIYVADLKTKTVQVLPMPAPEPVQASALPPCPGGVYAPDGMGGFYCLPAGQPQATPVTCALPSDGSGSFHVREVGLSGGLLVGAAEFWRENPAPRIKLAEGAFSATVSDVSALAKPKAPGWGALAFGLCTSAGCGAGAGAAFPPKKLLGLTAEPFLAAFSGGAGTGALGGLTVRW